MKRLFVLISLCLATCCAWAADPAIEFMDSVATEVIEQGLKGTHDLSQKEDFIRQKFTTILDLKTIGQFVLGTYWRKATDDEKNDFIKAFTDLMTKTWTDRFNLYNGQKIVFTGTRNAQNNQLYIDSYIQENPPVEVIWRVRPKDKSYLVIDIKIEGVSMVQSYRSEYTTYLQQHQGNLRSLIDELVQKTKTFKYGQAKSN